MVPFFVLARVSVGIRRICEGYRVMRDTLMRLLEPPIEALGFELLEIEFAQAGRGGTLRIYIDRGASGDRGASDDREARGGDDGVLSQDSLSQDSPSQGGI